MHSHRVIHRDLKLGNLFINDKMEVKVGDFGLATKLEFDGERKRTICGTPNYIAPEVLEGKQGHSYEVDIWSIGVIIYTLIIGKPPFETSDVKTTYKRIRMNAYNFPENVAISDAGRDLITKILNNDPTKRPTVDEILTHEWMNNSGTIPRLLPASTLACPPSSTYIRQFLPQNGGGQREANNFDKGAPNLSGTQSQAVLGGAGALSGRKAGDPRLASQRAPMTAPAGKAEEVKTPQQEEVWVKKWVDYSSKYGLGYHLSNQSVGVFFNDATKIVLDPNSFHFDYIERRTSDRQDVGKEYTIVDYPSTLQKKVTLLQHFRSYLEGSAKPKPNEKSAEQVVPSKRKITDLVYVKKWMRTRHAIMFRLSNKVVQVNFQDHTEIMLSSETKIVTYVNKRGERTTYPLGSAMDSANLEMVKRLKYTKDILTHMLNQNGTGTMQQPAENPATGGNQASSSRRAHQSNLGTAKSDAGATNLGPGNDFDVDLGMGTDP